MWASSALAVSRRFSATRSEGSAPRLNRAPQSTDNTVPSPGTERPRLTRTPMCSRTPHFECVAQVERMTLVTYWFEELKERMGEGN